MPRFKPPYPPEFRARIVELVRSGRTPSSLAKEFKPVPGLQLAPGARRRG